MFYMLLGLDINVLHVVRACLSLITDPEASIDEERDIIEALGMLGGFGVNILPVQGL